MKIIHYDVTDVTYGCIYVYRNKINNKCYVGQTVLPERRYKEHINAAKSGSTTHFHRALHKYGIENFDYFIIWDQYMPVQYAKENLNYWEEYYIKFFDSYNNGYNMTEGGFSGCRGEYNGMYGKHHKEETRKEWSKKRKGVPNPMKGKTYPEEKRKNMGLPKGHVAPNKGYKYPPEKCKNMGAPKGTHRVYREDGTWYMEK